MLGAIDTDLANAFHVSEVTINAWKVKYPDFLKSITAGKDAADANVAKSLYNRAMGYKGTDTKFATHEGKITDHEEYVKEYPPDTAAAIFWLKNRRRKDWKDKHDHDHSGSLIIRPQNYGTKDPE